MSRTAVAFFAVFFAAAFLFVLVLVNGSLAADAARDAIEVAGKTVVPVVFPSCVLASFLCSLGLPNAVCRLVPMRVFGLPQDASAPLLCSLFCAMPVGAVLASRLYADGRLTKDDDARLTAMTSLVSPAYLLYGVGARFGSRLFGLMLWLAEIAVALSFGVLFRGKSAAFAEKTTAPPPSLPPLSALADAVSSAALTSVRVVGFIAFFRVVSAVLSSVFPLTKVPLALFCEFSGGVSFALTRSSPVMAALAVGFGGLSSLLQIAAVLSSHGISVLPTVAVKCVSAVVLSASAAVYAHYCPLSPTAVTAFSSSDGALSLRLGCVLGGAVLCALSCGWIRAKIFSGKT